MELRQLAHFLAVAEANHFTRAATRVHLTGGPVEGDVRPGWGLLRLAMSAC